MNKILQDIIKLIVLVGLSYSILKIIPSKPLEDKDIYMIIAAIIICNIFLSTCYENFESVQELFANSKKKPPKRTLAEQNAIRQSMGMKPILQNNLSKPFKILSAKTLPSKLMASKILQPEIMHMNSEASHPEAMKVMQPEMMKVMQPEIMQIKQQVLQPELMQMMQPEIMQIKPVIKQVLQPEVIKVMQPEVVQMVQPKVIQQQPALQQIKPVQQQPALQQIKPVQQQPVQQQPVQQQPALQQIRPVIQQQPVLQQIRPVIQQQPVLQQIRPVLQQPIIQQQPVLQQVKSNDNLGIRYMNLLISELKDKQVINDNEINNINLKLSSKLLSLEEIINSLEQLKNMNKDSVNNNYNELPNEFMNPIGSGVSSWNNQYTILNTDKWTVPQMKPPVCVTSTPCPVCPLDGTNISTVSLNNWDNSNKISNNFINKNWANNQN
jgi:hypothetical protein